MAVATLVVAAFLGLRKLRRSRRFQQASSPALRALPRSITTIGIITIGIITIGITITDIGITELVAPRLSALLVVNSPPQDHQASRPYSQESCRRITSHAR
ncbi:MAG: hypothetical protein WBD11_00285 [Xanthobacteraceae bacterium]|jgi:energy-converting hydrogenase Eha subunit A